MILNKIQTNYYVHNQKSVFQLVKGSQFNMKYDLSFNQTF
jgi:hypothetical protein